ncbi:MAG TPA: protein-disulfide reductase DsbD N-terminal domain-containing protein [Acidobacteriaceae bacterium]|nr:protein-disulfide reductase DsbD N-terminal domain-containing protein [Acidobacteriaceae bacterium]
MTRLILTFLFVLTLRPLHAQLDMNAPEKQRDYVSYVAEPQTVPAGKHAALEVHFHMQSGYHVNSHTPKSDLLIATTLTLAPASGVKQGMLAYPAGQPYSFSFDPTDKLDVYARDFTVKLPVVAAAGPHVIDGSLGYQACDNASCYPPRVLPIKLVFNAK